MAGHTLSLSVLVARGRAQVGDSDSDSYPVDRVQQQLSVGARAPKWVFTRLKRTGL